MKHFLLLILVFLSNEVFPQSEDLRSFLKTGGDIITSPLRYDGHDWIKFGGVVLVTAGAFTLDDDVKAMVLRNRTNIRTGYIDDQWYYLGAVTITAGTYIYGLAAENDEIHQLGLDLAEASLYASGLNSLIKFAAGRNRPYTTTDVTEFHPFRKALIHSSLGSAHATLAFAVATVFSKHTDNIFWKTGWFAAAGFVGAIRIYNNMHWLSDVILGSSIGYFVGSYVTGEKGKNFEVNVIPGGLSLRINF